MSVMKTLLAGVRFAVLSWLITDSMYDNPFFSYPFDLLICISANDYMCHLSSARCKLLLYIVMFAPTLTGKGWPTSFPNG